MATVRTEPHLEIWCRLSHGVEGMKVFRVNNRLVVRFPQVQGECFQHPPRSERFLLCTSKRDWRTPNGGTQEISRLAFNPAHPLPLAGFAYDSRFESADRTNDLSAPIQHLFLMGVDIGGDDLDPRI